MTDLLAELREHERDYPARTHGPLCGRAAAEIARLQEAKRRALAVADERAIEANGVRDEIERLRRTETCARLVLKAWETAGAATAQPLTDSMVRLRDALAAE